MATQHSRSAARLMMAPAVVLLLGWMLVPLTMTLYFSFRKYLPLRGGDLGWVGFDNYVRFVSSSAFWPSVQATLVIVGGVLFITVVLGVLLAVWCPPHPGYGRDERRLGWLRHIPDFMTNVAIRPEEIGPPRLAGRQF